MGVMGSQGSGWVKAKKSGIAVPTVERTFQILETLASAVDGCGVSELSRELGLAKSSTFNILTSLEQLGYIYRADGKFHLGLKLYSLSSVVVENMDLRRVAAPILKDLVENTGETANLGIIQGNEAIYIDCLMGPHPVTVHTWPGKRLPLHSTALGKVLLAWLPTNEMTAVLLQDNMSALTPSTITTIESFTAQLDEVRAKGYSVDDEEDAIGMRCIGAPVFDHSGRVVAAISLTAPAQRLLRSKIDEIAPIVIGCALEISTRLGYTAGLHKQTRP
jgi:DNA-binding IclR family transcriptional regulator